MEIKKAEQNDLPDILKLQYLAYQSEAELLNNYDIPPLKQTLEEITAEFKNGIILKAVDESGNITGSVRGQTKNGVLYIGKLFVHPQKRGRGIGTKLLKEIEQSCPHKRCELFTSSKSEKNLKLYLKSRYKIFDKKEINPKLTFIYLQKQELASSNKKSR